MNLVHLGGESYIAILHVENPQNSESSFAMVKIRLNASLVTLNYSSLCPMTLNTSLESCVTGVDGTTHLSMKVQTWLEVNKGSRKIPSTEKGVEALTLR